MTGVGCFALSIRKWLITKIIAFDCSILNFLCVLCLIFIENNPEHHKKWLQFKEKDMLRKIDVALNCVTESPEEILAATSETLQKIADTAQQKLNTPLEKKTYKIIVPKVDEEFPDLGNIKTQIFPLPISHENQCSTVGLASNLDRFAEEFDFKCEKKERFMPVKMSSKEFALDKAYERFAFLKSLQKHKEQQKTYEQILRGTGEEVNAENEFTDEILITVDENSSSNDSNDDDD